MNIFLNTKHWQLFIALVGSMYLARQAIISAGEGAGSPVGFIIAKFIFAVVLYGWLWSICTGCYRTLASELKPSAKFMQFGVNYVVVYLLISDLVVLIFSGFAPEFFTTLNLFSLVVLAFLMGFTAKQLVTLVKGEDVSVFAYVGTFALLFLYPAGVWFIQPTVNRLLGEQKK